MLDRWTWLYIINIYCTIMDKYMKKLEKAQQAYHLEWRDGHFIVQAKRLKFYKKELMTILNMSWKDMKSLPIKIFYEIYGDMEDNPIIDRPFSSITHHIIKSENPNNPYHILTKNLDFLKKLEGLFQYGVNIQPLDKNTTYLHSHNRYVHSLDVACNIELIMRNNGFSEKDITKWIILGLLHDIATPAFGDLTMKAFPQLKEEESFSTYMQYYPKVVEYIQSHFDISLEELQSWVKNEGIIGKILDIADRLAYTARDVSSVSRGTLLSEEQNNIPGKSIGNILEKDPYIFDIMMEISVKDNQIVFENSARLKNILFLRATMHNLIYLNPYLWTREEYFGLILQYLVEEWFLSLTQLQTWVYKDHVFINECFLTEYIYKNNMIDLNPGLTYDFFDLEICASKEEAIAKIEELKKITDPNVPIHYLKTPAFKPGTHYLVRDNWSVKPLAEVMDAEELSQINQLSQATNKHLVLCPQKKYHENYKKHPKLYAFLCKKADEEYNNLLAAK